MFERIYFEIPCVQFEDLKIWLETTAMSKRVREVNPRVCGS